MNERLSALDHSLNAPQRADSEGDWQERIADERDSQETRLGDQQELGMRRKLLQNALMRLNER
jgi:RNA polymerase sigma-32 factor